MGHPQLATPMLVENSNCDINMETKLQQKIPRDMDVRFNWVRDRVKQKTLTYFGKLE